MGWLSILNPPDTLQNYVSFTSEIHEPDGQLGVNLLNTDGTQGEQYYADLKLNLLSTWSFSDERKSIEPEEVVIAEYDGKEFLLATLQDPVAVVVYDITDPTTPIWDHILFLVRYSVLFVELQMAI